MTFLTPLVLLLFFLLLPFSRHALAEEVAVPLPGGSAQEAPRQAQDEALEAAPALRPSARLLFARPELLRPGNCAAYREGGAGWIVTDPVFWLRGTVVEAEIRTRRLEPCPEVPGKTLDRYSREEFNRLANARPCVSRDDLTRDEELGIVRLRVDDWETPWAKRAANTFRLYQGHYLDKPLKKGEELEIEADLLGGC